MQTCQLPGLKPPSEALLGNDLSRFCRGISGLGRARGSSQQSLLLVKLDPWKSLFGLWMAALVATNSAEILSLEDLVEEAYPRGCRQVVEV